MAEFDPRRDPLYQAKLQLDAAKRERFRLQVYHLLEALPGHGETCHGMLEGMVTAIHWLALRLPEPERRAVAEDLYAIADQVAAPDEQA